MKIIFLIMLLLLLACDSIKIVNNRKSDEIVKAKDLFQKCVKGKGRLRLQFSVRRSKSTSILYQNNYGYLNEKRPYKITGKGFEKHDTDCVLAELRKLKFFMSNHIHDTETIDHELIF